LATSQDGEQQVINKMQVNALRHCDSAAVYGVTNANAALSIVKLLYFTELKSISALL